MLRQPLSSTEKRRGSAYFAPSVTVENLTVPGGKLPLNRGAAADMRADGNMGLSIGAQFLLKLSNLSLKASEAKFQAAAFASELRDT